MNPNESLDDSLTYDQHVEDYESQNTIPSCIQEAEQALNSQALFFDLNTLRYESPFSPALDLALNDICMKSYDFSGVVSNSQTEVRDHSHDEKSTELVRRKTSEASGDNTLENSCLQTDSDNSQELLKLVGREEQDYKSG